MIRNYFVLLTGFLCVMAFNHLKAQESPVLSFNIPSQNNIKFNRFLQNPTYSLVEENNTFISVYHRNQWIQFKDSPSAYLLSYSGAFGENTGMGIGIYQQNLGIITSFGATGNYAYRIGLTRDIDLTLGFNLAYYNSGVDNNRAVTSQDDPLLLEFEKTSLMAIKPGINISYKNLHLGVFAENLVDYNFKTNKLASEYIDRSYAAQLMYVHDFQSGVGLFENSKLRLAANGSMTETFGLGLGGSILVDFPQMGWLKTGVDDYYGVGAGFGIHLSKRLSIGYTYERTIKEGLVNLGPTHEVNLVFAIGKKRSAGVFNDALVKRRQKKRLEANTMSIAERDGLNTNGEDEAYQISENRTNENVQQQGEQYASIRNATEKGMPKTVPNTVSSKELLGRSNRLERERRNRMNRIARLQLELDHENQYLLKLLEREDAQMASRKNQLEEQIQNLKQYAQRENQVNAIKSEDIETIILRSADPVENKIAMPKTAEELKHAENGYYLVQEPVNALTEEDFVSVDRFDLLPDAVRAYNVRYANGAEEGLYIIHVDNPEQLSKTSDNRNTNSNTRSTTSETAHKEALASNEVQNNNSVARQAVSEKKNKKPEPKPKKQTKTKKNEKNNEINHPQRRRINLNSPDVSTGFYIIANVFSEHSNAEKFMATLRTKGLRPNSFINPKNNYKYVYLRYFSHWEDALECYNSKVEGLYQGPIWILDNYTE
ncbi:PorP/SprF family type IX secretion system membrane protein [Marixanthomonas spongiae]|uniref:Type IX secretion system membrane protein PorP/SprF n=1 Tax=Marixanthomonas spongiae TaxID=2174845 RepID=A0A2U0I448_9FLAO|nr:PorP/SprF family type IX secretion system membrane protein [Marixanthomonas spongiae]PVW15886.1 hypothetical protein DDV96_06370 [Marixanthomonas spongiae]